MKPAPFQYHRARSLAEAAGMLATLDNARVLAGGQSLMPMMNMRYVALDHVVDLNPVSELAGIEIDEEALRIGAMTRQRDMLESSELAQRCPLIAEALGFVGHVQTRNRGTIGGSLAHMDPAAELPGVAALLDARVTLTRDGGTREVSMADFPLNYMTPDIEPDEILTRMSFNPWPPGHGWDFREFAQRHGDFAIVGVGSLMTVDGGGRIDRAAAVLIGVDDGPRRLSDVETMLLGETPTLALFREAGDLARRQPMLADALVSEAYRQHLADVLVRRSLASAAARAGGHADAG